MDYFKFFRISTLVIGLALFSNLMECGEVDSVTILPAEKESVENWNSIIVTASAYNSRETASRESPSLTAWGDTLKPGMKSIAVSEDLLAKGLTYNTEVRIQGLEGTYVVNDKMHSKWTNKIDIYMGVDRKTALNWGSRKVEICYPVTDY